MADFDLPGFPKTPAAKSVLMSFIWDLVGSTEQLQWLLEQAFPRMRQFSMPELRAIFCSRFRPADGIEPDLPAETPGFRTEDLERRAQEIEAADTNRKLTLWSVEMRLLGEAPLDNPMTALALPPGACQMPPAKPTRREIKRADEKALLRDAEQTLKENLQRTYLRRSPEEIERMIADLQQELNERRLKRDG